MAILDMRRAPGPLGPEASDTIRRVLVPLDGTRRDDRAVERAIPLARALNAEVELIRTYTAGWPQHSHSGGIFGGIGRHPEGREPLHAASLYLARLEGVFQARGVRTFSRAMQWPMVDAILDAAETNPPDLIFMPADLSCENGTHRQADVRPLDEVLAKSRAPVLLDDTGAMGVLPHAAGAELRVVIVARDGGGSARAQEYASVLAHALGARLTVSCVLGNTDADAGEQRGGLDGALLETLARERAHLLIVCPPRTVVERRTATDLALKLSRAAGSAVLFMP